MFAFTARTYARWAANIFLFLSILLTIFFLTGTTSNSPAVRGLYALELSYKTAPITTKSAAGSAGTTASAARTPLPSRTAPVTREPATTIAPGQTNAVATNTHATGTPGAKTSAGSAFRSVKPASSTSLAATLVTTAATQRPSTAQAAQPSELKKRQLVIDTSPAPVKVKNPDGSYKLNPDGSYIFDNDEGDPQMLRYLCALSVTRARNKAKAEADLKKWKAKQKTMVRGGGRAPKPDSIWTFYDPVLKVTKTEDLLAKRTAVPKADDGEDIGLAKRFIPDPEYPLTRKPRAKVGTKTIPKVYSYGHHKVTVTALAKRTAAPKDNDSDIEDLTAQDVYDDVEEPTTSSPSLAKRQSICDRILEKQLSPHTPRPKYKVYTIVKHYGTDDKHTKTVSIPVAKRSAAPELEDTTEEDGSPFDNREPDVYEIVEDSGDGKTETNTITLPDFAKRSADPEADQHVYEIARKGGAGRNGPITINLHPNRKMSNGDKNWYATLNLFNSTLPGQGSPLKHYKRSEDELEGVYELVEEFKEGRKETHTVVLPVSTDVPDPEPTDTSLDREVDETISPADSSSADLKKREAAKSITLSQLSPGGAMTGAWRSYLDMVERMKRIRGKHYPKLPAGVYKREYPDTVPASHIYKRHPTPPTPTPLSITFSYYGLCATSTHTICSRTKLPNLPASTDPFDIVSLAGTLQSTLSPAPPILALVLLAISWVLYIYICLRPSTRRCRTLFFLTSASAVIALLHAVSVLHTIGQTAMDVLSMTEVEGVVARKGVRVVAVGVVAAVLAGCAFGAVVAGDRSGRDKRGGDEGKDDVAGEIVDIYASMNTPKLRKEWGVRRDGVVLPPGKVAPGPMWGTMRGGVV